MITRAKPFRISRLIEIAIGLVEPSVVLLENGPAFSVLTAESINHDRFRGQLILNDVSQLRIEETGHSIIRRFPSVCLGFDADSELWLARDAATGTVFRCPSKSPYVVLTLTLSEHEKLRQAESVSDVDCLFRHFRQRFGNFPGFYSPDNETLISPDDYASAFDFGEIKERYY
jgi:hypothetical protein